MAKCNQCGFLSVRDEFNGKVREAAEITRVQADHRNGDGSLSTAKLLCYRNSPCFPKQDTNMRVEIIAKIDADIACSEFESWLPGRSPKEHQEMIEEKMRLAWQAEQAEMNRNFQADQAQLSRKHNIRTLAVSLVGVAIAAYSAFKAKEPIQPVPVQVEVKLPATQP